MSGYVGGWVAKYGERWLGQGDGWLGREMGGYVREMGS
jgi:hypothetical protein